MSYQAEYLKRRNKRWVESTHRIGAAIADVEDALQVLIDDHLEDYECDEWRDGYPPKPTDHPLWEVALLLEQARGLVDERIEKLQEAQT